MSTVIGVDLGGTKCSIARYDTRTWSLEEKVKISTDAAKGFSHVMDAIVSKLSALRKDDTIAVGFGVPSLIRQPEGRLINTVNIPGGKDIPLKQMMEQRLGLPVAVENDVRSFTIAEARMGAGKGHRIVVGIALGTGVGGGIVIDGKVFHGHDGFAGEIGHMLLQPGCPPFATEDLRGRVEQFLSGTAMGSRCQAASHPSDYLNGAVCAFMQPQIYRETAWLCTSLTYLLNPSIIVFGGSAGASLMLHISEIEKELERWLLPGTPAPILKAAILEDPGTLGAALCTQ